MTDEPITSASPPAIVSFALASQNTTLAMQRTRLAADRTLMAVIRTSLSLISFGFTIFQIAENLTEKKVLKFNASFPHFGIGLVVLGILVLLFGIIYHAQTMLALRSNRRRMTRDGLIGGQDPFPPSFTLVAAMILLGLGIVVGLGMIFHIGPLD
jgi:putative membrane protein